MTGDRTPVRRGHVKIAVRIEATAVTVAPQTVARAAIAAQSTIAIQAFSVGAPLRLGFIPFRSLVDETQDTGCPDGGFPTSVDHDVNLKSC
jgi:hypothetical protein